MAKVKNDMKNSEVQDFPSEGVPYLKWVWRLIVALIIAGALLTALFATCFVYIRPNEVGIKEVKIGFRRGIQKKVYGPGYAFRMPFGLERIYKFPRDVQVLELTDSKGTASKFARIEKAAHIQTSDGFFVDVDVSILYRIVDPYLLFTAIGPGKLFVENGIIPKAEPILKEALGVLTTEEFYNSPKRTSKTLFARELLNRELNPKGIQVDHVLIRYFKYSPEIQKNIEEKKLKDQLVFKNQAEARAAYAKAQLKKIIEEGKAKVKVKIQEGKAYVTRRSAQKELYLRQKKAEADLLVKSAGAEKTKLLAKAYAGRGSERMVALKMAEVLKGLQILVLPSDGAGGFNPLDLDRTMRMFQSKTTEDKGTAK